MKVKEKREGREADRQTGSAREKARDRPRRRHAQRRKHRARQTCSLSTGSHDECHSLDGCSNGDAVLPETIAVLGFRNILQNVGMFL